MIEEETEKIFLDFDEIGTVIGNILKGKKITILIPNELARKIAKASLNKEELVEKEIPSGVEDSEEEGFFVDLLIYYTDF